MRWTTALAAVASTICAAACVAPAGDELEENAADRAGTLDSDEAATGGAELDPDPLDEADVDAAAVRAGAPRARHHRCDKHERLSPKGFTLVVDLSFADDLHEMEPYLRTRDVLITGGSHTDEVRHRFPCNRLVTLLAGGDRHDVHDHGPDIGGLLLDLEPAGFGGWSWSESFAEHEAAAFVHRVHRVHRDAGLVPVWSGSWNYAHIANEANLDYQLVQNQAQCKVSGASFADGVRHVVGQYHAAGAHVANVGFEVSMRPGGDNAVSPGDAAWCAHLGWKAGARAIFAYGLFGHASNWKGFFHGLDHVGLRAKR